MSDDSVAEDQIAAFIGRFLAERGELGDLSDKLTRLRYVLDRMVARRRQDSVAMSHARTAGSIILGLRNSDMRSRVSSVVRRGSVQAALDNLSEWMPTEPWPVPAFDAQCVADVYVLAAPEFPGVFKVGYSTQVPERITKLRWQYGIELRLVTTFAGTMFDEHLLQHDMRSLSLANEWFDLSGRWRAKHPLMPLFTPDRMWATLKASPVDVSAAHKFKKLEA